MPVYDIVAADSRSPRDGRYIEKVGQYNPLVTSGATMLDRERVTHWLKTGAQPTDTVRNILSREGILLAMQMESKGIASEEIAAAVDAHVMRHRNRETVKANTRKVAAEAPAEEVAAEAPAEIEATAPVEEAAAEAPAETEATAPVEEAAPAAEAVAETAPAEETPAAETAEAAPAEETPAAEASAPAAESNEEEKQGE